MYNPDNYILKFEGYLYCQKNRIISDFCLHEFIKQTIKNISWHSYGYCNVTSLTSNYVSYTCYCPSLVYTQTYLYNFRTNYTS